MALETLGPTIVVASAFAIAGLERLYPYNPSQRLLRSGFWIDLVGYGIVQSYLLGLAIAKLIQVVDAQTGLSRRALVSAWPLWIQCAVFFVAHDLYIYTFHRFQHHNKYFWRIHEAHHSGHDVDWLSGTRSHALEILVNQSIEFAPIVLLGAAPEVAVFKAVIDAVWGMYIHSNLDVRSGPLQFLINGPEMHRWHHATSLVEPGANFATKLALWDWLFGSAYRPADKAEDYGLWNHEPFPSGFVDQQMHAFRRFEEKGVIASGESSRRG